MQRQSCGHDLAPRDLERAAEPPRLRACEFEYDTSDPVAEVEAEAAPEEFQMLSWFSEDRGTVRESGEDECCCCGRGLLEVIGKQGIG